MRLPSLSRGWSIIPTAFATTVTMWGVGYFARLPAVMLPSPWLLLLMLLTLIGGGFWLGRLTGEGLAAGSLMGVTSGLINLLVLGSFLSSASSPNALVPSALWWVPLSVVVSGVLGAAGADLGARYWLRKTPVNWPSVFVWVAVSATLLLLAVGGLVTSAEAGLAVVDWPNSYGYNMFLYPFSRMTGPIYYEHAHRLFGALVGLTTLILAIYLQRAETRRSIRILGWAVFGMVLLQGILGGLRVTGHFTMSDSPALTSPNLALALVHGVFGQLCFATMVALGVLTATRWKAPPQPLRRGGVGTDRILSTLLVGLMVGQLVLGAAQRHFHELLFAHILVGVAFVVPLTLNVGFRAWGLNTGQRLLQRLGLALVVGVFIQLVLGIAAWVAKSGAAAAGAGTIADLTITTAHQWFGALLLGTAVMLACWNRRLLQPDGSAEAAT